MNYFRRTLLRLALKGADLSLVDPTGWEWIGSGPTWSKMPVGDATQFQIAAAFSAIRLIAETIGTLPLHLYRRTDKGRQKATDHPLYSLVHDQPNEYMTAVEWKESMAVSIITMGQAYNPVARFESTGRVISIQSVHKSRVQPEKQRDGSIMYWLTKPDGSRVLMSRRDICPVRGFGGTGELEGMAPHRLHSNSLALTMAVEKYGAEFFGSGGRPLGVLTTESEFREEQRDKIRANFAKYVRESWQSGQLPLLEKGTKYQQVTTKNDEAQFLETRKHQIAEIGRIYRVPLHMLMEMDRATYANSEEERSMFLEMTLLPYLVRIAQALNSCLLTKEERRTHYFEFDVNGFLRANSGARAQFYKDMRTAGAITQNEIRRWENLPEVDGADDLHVPLNMAPVDQLTAILSGNKKGNE